MKSLLVLVFALVLFSGCHKRELLNNGCTCQQNNQSIIDSIVIPNIFTPNGDGINDFWQITAPPANFFFINLRIKSGRTVVFETNKLNEMWDGTFNESESRIGKYDYILEYNKYGTDQTIEGCFHLNNVGYQIDNCDDCMAANSNDPAIDCW